MVVSRLRAAIDVVNGIPFGQAWTQFCEFPQLASPPSPIIVSKRSALFIAPVGCALNKRTCDNGAGPIKSDLLFTFGQASKQTPHVIHFESSYAHWRFLSGIRGPGPKSYVPSIGIHAFTFFNESNIRLLSTCKSRTTGNVLIGSKRIGCSSWSTIAEQDWRGFPLITIEQAPQTSSKQFISQIIGVVFSPFLF